jgi:sulfate permease, SulP family
VRLIAILEAKRAGLFAAKHLAKNVVAGVIVGVVALPLAMAFAIASGAKPEQGLYTAIVAGLLTSMFGGSRLQIAGPTGAFIVILAGITAKYGITGLQVATLMAGVILILMGMLRFGSVIKFIPDPVIVGFTTGIGVIIFVGQWKDFFGLKTTSSTEHFLDKLVLLVSALPTLDAATTGLGMASLLILILSPKIVPRIPAPLLALVAATLAQAFFRFPSIATVGSAFGGIPQTLPSFQIPSITLTDAAKLIGPAFTIALLGAIESLLSAVVADGMAGTKHDSNQELIGQGISNIAAPLFGGFASTGAIARTATNIRNGASSPLAGIVHSITLLLIVLVCAPLAADVPLCALSAILFVVAFNMSELPHFARLVRTAPKPDVVILLVTFLLTVLADLVVAVNAGVLLAALLFMKRMASAVEIQDQTNEFANQNDADLRLPKDVVVFSIEGPLFFGAVSNLERVLASVQDRSRTIILRMGNVPFLDVTGIASLQEMVDSCKPREVRVILCEIRPNVRSKLERAGLIQAIGDENLFPNIGAALSALTETTN